MRCVGPDPTISCTVKHGVVFAGALVATIDAAALGQTVPPHQASEAPLLFHEVPPTIVWTHTFELRTLVEVVLFRTVVAVSVVLSEGSGVTLEF